MIDFISTTKMNGRPVVDASCLLGSRLLERSGLSAPALRGVARPKASAVAAEAHAYALAFAAKGAGAVCQETQNHMWAFRGLEPWRDPA